MTRDPISDAELVRVGRSNARNLYWVTPGGNWKADRPFGVTYDPVVGRLVAQALNDYCTRHPEMVRVLDAHIPPRDPIIDPTQEDCT